MPKDELSARRDKKVEPPVMGVVSAADHLKNKRVCLDVAGRVLNYNVASNESVSNDALDELAERVAYLADQLMEYFA